MPTTDLTQWLRTRDAAELEHVLALRSDVLAGAPVRDLADLADRLTQPTSVAMVVRVLPTPALQVLEALVALGAGATAERAAGLLDPGADLDEHLRVVTAWADHLTACALTWPDGDGRIRLNPGVLEPLGVPLRIGVVAALLVPEISATELAKVVRRWGLDVPKRKAELVDAVLTRLGDPAEVRRLVGGAPPEVTDVLLEHAAAAAERMREPMAMDEAEETPAYLRTQAEYRRHRAALQWATEHGLAFGSRYDPITAEIPAEVLLALMDPSARTRFDPAQPPVPTAPVAPEQVGATASAAVTEILGVVMATFEHLMREPVPMRKTGGVGTREISRLSKTVGATAADVRLALEVGLHLGLVVPAGGRLGTTAELEPWRAQSPAFRMADVISTWVGLRFVPTQERDADGAAMPALWRFDDGDPAVAARSVLFDVLDGLPEAEGATSVEDLAGVLTWRLPIVLGLPRPDVVRPTITEAERLGLVALGRLTAVGAQLLDGWDTEELAGALSGMLPEVQSRAAVGSDLTVMVLGSPAPHVVDLLDAVAEREGRGQVSTWRLTPSSVRGALDAGYGADDVLARLRTLAGGDLPQPVEYLVADVARRHGHLQVQAAGAVVVAPDEALLVEVAATRALRGLGLRAVAPTVLVSPSSPGEVLAALRAAGYLPVEAGADGAPVVEVRRLPAPPTADDAGPAEPVQGEGAVVADPDGAEPADVDAEGVDADGVAAEIATWAAEHGFLPASSAGRPEPEAPADVVSRLLSGEPPPRPAAAEGVGEEIAQTARRLSRVEVDQLAHAVTHGLPVQIRYRSRSGGVSVRVVSDLAVGNGYLIGWCELRGDQRTFALTNLLGVVAVA